ncbi:TPA: serine protease [Proteus mirabilis]|nr:serine protease [Proteus mirabilis]
MLDHEFRVATCKVKCGDESGTGSLITPKIVLTASHCVDSAVDGSSEVNVTFNLSSNSLIQKASVLAHDENLDIALLELETESDIPPINLSERLPLGGSHFYSYGWPVSKLTMGHRLEGTIAQTFDSPKLGSDIEISIDRPLSLSNYQGFSGAALVCDGSCVGVIRVSIEQTLGVISIARLRDFFYDHGVIVETNENTFEHQTLAPRKGFNRRFDKFVLAQSSRYLFINGAHGIGKSTFCETYTPIDSSLEYFGTYSFTPTQSHKNATQLAQPQEFFNWLNMQVSMIVTGNPGRKETGEYTELIDKVESLINTLSEAYTSKDKKGILFIDGLDEVERQDPDALNKFIGLLPMALPSGVVIVFSAPNYEQFATRLGNRIESKACISIPSLTDSAVKEFCYKSLKEQRVSSKIVNIICERSQGHPLYLRYLVDLVNTGTTDTELKNLPLIDGNIRKYYDLLWLKLKDDNDAVNLLAIAVRLRWGISISHFTTILTPNEQSVLVGTLGRIQHLLLTPSETTIYHSSFSHFLLEKTALREQDIQLRLFDHCENQIENKYCLLNLIYHGLKVEASDNMRLVTLCSQNWVDACVYQGIEPDTLLEDLKGVLNVATQLGSLVETVRILLLQQRIQFRYNTLFAQSATLTANALISLRKEQEVLQHVLRYKQLIIPLEEALIVALKLVDASYNIEALELLNVVDKYLTEGLEQVSKGNGLSYRQFLDIYDLQLQQQLIRVRAGDDKARTLLFKFQFYWMEIIDKTSKNKEASKLIRSEMLTYMQAASMCLISNYISISQLREHYSGSLKEIAEPLVFTVPLYQDLCVRYGIHTDKTLLNQVLYDIKTLISEGWDEQWKVHPSIVDCFISIGATKDIIVALGDISDEAPLQIKFVSDDNVSVDYSELEMGIATWRLKAFIEPNCACPSLIPLSTSNWLNGIESIYKVIAWCDGSARQFKETENIVGLDTVRRTLSQDLLDHLRFGLAVRVQWEDSYGLPESIFPHIYHSITTILTEFYPSDVCNLLNFINEQFSSQCGIYSEGFRSILNSVLSSIVGKPLSEEVEDQVFTLVERWREYVVSNVENRYELVPELLRIVPLYTKLDALDEAIKTYQLVLSFSMGPSWYKEDQFGLMITALESISRSTKLDSGELSQIAGLLDSAGGEMTFQRFVRYAKRDFLGALCSRGDFSNAVNYFIKQTYGTLAQMHQEVTRGDIDKVSELKGTRFPGSALDEQDSILSFIKPLISCADWQLCWAILESFQFGDSRYISRFAEVYGLLIEKVSGDDDNSFTIILSRLEIICESEFENKTHCSKFIASITPFIPARYKKEFEAKFATYLPLSEVNKSDSKFSTESTAKPQNSENDNGRESTDELYMPGTFGSRISISEAITALSKAEKYLRRKNNSAAQQEIISGLTTIQNGAWPIWAGQIPEVTEGQSLLLKTGGSVSDLVKLYSPLIVSERYAENWRIADGLIEWLASHASNDEQVELLRLTNEHTHIMVGQADKEAADYKFLEEQSDNDLSNCLATLLLHIIEHPTWLRREKASEMLVWLSNVYPDFVRLFASKAFSMDCGVHSDVICGALEQISTKQNVWEMLAENLDFNYIKQHCKHVGRYSVLIRLARQASMRGSQSATEALSTLTERFDSYVGKNNLSHVDLPLWAECVRPNWSKLEKLGLTGINVIEKAESLLKEVCSPLSIEVSLEIEQLLAQGYNGNSNYPKRWLDKVSYVFQVALQDVANESEYKHIETIFRQYNPTCLEKLRIINFNSPATQWLRSQKPKPVNGKNIYLDYLERLWIEGELRLVRLTAYLTNDPKDPKDLNVPSGRFLSFDKPSLDNTRLIDVCANVKPLPAYFGSFTPAIPTTNFMSLTGAVNSNLKRSWWKSGRLKEAYEGAPFNEGCFLSIDINAIKLPHGFNLIWVLELDLEPIALISFG